MKIQILRKRSPLIGNKKLELILRIYITLSIITPLPHLFRLKIFNIFTLISKRIWKELKKGGIPLKCWRFSRLDNSFEGERENSRFLSRFIWLDEQSSHRSNPNVRFGRYVGESSAQFQPSVSRTRYLVHYVAVFLTMCLIFKFI